MASLLPVFHPQFYHSKPSVHITTIELSKCINEFGEKIQTSRGGEYEELQLDN